MQMADQIKKIIAREVLDSRGMPTLEVDVHTRGGALGRAMVPSGASTGRYEAVELRDENPQRYGGKGVRRAIQNITEQMAPLLKGRSVRDQRGIDEVLKNLDGTPSKSHLGGNAILAVSLAVSRASAAAQGVSFYRLLSDKPQILPVPLMNILNGGRHADNSVDIQEFMIAPLSSPSFGDALRMGVEVFYALRSVLKDKGYTTNVGDEGGFAPQLRGDEEAIQLIILAVEKAGYSPGKDCYIALDIAATELYNPTKKHYTLMHLRRSFSLPQWIDFWGGLDTKVPYFFTGRPYGRR